MFPYVPITVRVAIILWMWSYSVVCSVASFYSVSVFIDTHCLLTWQCIAAIYGCVPAHVSSAIVSVDALKGCCYPSLPPSLPPLPSPKAPQQEAGGEWGGGGGGGGVGMGSPLGSKQSYSPEPTPLLHQHLPPPPTLIPHTHHHQVYQQPPVLSMAGGDPMVNHAHAHQQLLGGVALVTSSAEGATANVPVENPVSNCMCELCVCM